MGAGEFDIWEGTRVRDGEALLADYDRAEPGRKREMFVDVLLQRDQQRMAILLDHVVATIRAEQQAGKDA